MSNALPDRLTTDNRLPCQVCGRSLTMRKDGLTKPHKPRRSSEPYSQCQGTGYRQARWPVGQLLWHHAGDLWEVADDRGGQYGDYYLRCLRGREKGREMVAHGEYMHRHGWKTTDEAAAWSGVPTSVLADLAAEVGFDAAECC